MKDQLSNDVQYKEMFGGQELLIKRHFKVRRVEPEPAPLVPQIINIASQEEVELQGSIKDETELPPQLNEEVEQQQGVPASNELSPSGAVQNKDEEQAVKKKNHFIPLPEGFSSSNNARKAQEFITIAFGRTESKPRDTLGYQFGQMKSNQKYQPKQRDKAYVPLLLDYLECKISHKRLQSAATTEPTSPFCSTPLEKGIPVQKDKDEKWAVARQYYKIDFQEGVGRLKKPLVNEQKRRRLNILLKNDKITVRAVHHNMLERVIYA